MNQKKRGRKAPPWRATPSAPLDHAVPERRSRPTHPTAVAEVELIDRRVAPSGRASLSLGGLLGSLLFLGRLLLSGLSFLCHKKVTSFL